MLVTHKNKGTVLGCVVYVPDVPAQLLLFCPKCFEPLRYFKVTHET